MVVVRLFDYEITIQNNVMTGAFSESIDLGVANSRLEGSKCKWQRFPGLVFKLKVPSATFLLFRSGKFVCTGTKSKTQGHQAITNLLNRLKTEAIVSNNCTYKSCIKNLVASITITGVSIPLEQFITQFKTALYEPEKFPAVIYKMNQLKATFLVFSTGKLVCSGLANEEELKNTVKTFYTQLIEKNILEKS
jgi:transcription initiation factor TFIID TATA-box-binding protein